MSGRRFDVVLCLLALPLLLPVMALIAVVTWLDSPGPVLYSATRVGKGGRPFQMLKFRTMRHGSTGASLTSAGDERITPIGAWLRRNRLDEMPQLFNVLLGEMALVGPRPELSEFVEAFPEQYRRILSVAPGITGPTQLVYVDEGRLLEDAVDPNALYRELILPHKVRSDLDYVARGSVRGDLQVLWRTSLLPFARMGSTRVQITPGVGATTRSSVVTSLLALALGLLFGIDAALG